MKNKLVSIIIPYYKKKKFFKETISSINNQKYKDYEVIIIYDDEDTSELDFVKKAVLPIKKKKKFRRLWLMMPSGSPFLMVAPYRVGVRLTPTVFHLIGS